VTFEVDRGASHEQCRQVAALSTDVSDYVEHGRSGLGRDEQV
jgi:hypothetical protein